MGAQRRHRLLHARWCHDAHQRATVQTVDVGCRGRHRPGGIAVTRRRDRRGPLRARGTADRAGQHVVEDVRDAQVAHPLPIGGNGVPWRRRRRGLGQCVGVGGHEVVPAGAVVEIAVAELPSFVGAVDAILEPGPLLVARDVQEHLDDGRALVDQHLLELLDVGVALAPHRLRRQFLHPHHQHVLVVAAVEHPDLAPLGSPAVDPPQVVVAPSPHRSAPRTS